VAWKAEIPGEGVSSPIVSGDAVFVTSALEKGARRVVVCLDRKSGKIRWQREIRDGNPETASAVTGHAAPTPVTDGARVVAWFGNAGLVCYDFSGERLWHRKLGEFVSELGIASSPVLHKGAVILVCDHDGGAPRSFDSFLVALDLKTGETLWKTGRPGLERSWSTPLLAGGELVVAAQDELRAYDPSTGKPLWQSAGMAGWVAPSPVSGMGLVFAVSGKDGPAMAVKPGGRVVWHEKRGGPYVCSPILVDGRLYVHDESGILTCRSALDGKEIYRERLKGRFSASAVAADGKIYFTNEEGTTSVVKSGPAFELLAENRLGAEAYASPAVSRGALFIRTGKGLWCLRSAPEE
jgi:outer membrane protein assembly factor BamB